MVPDPVATTSAPPERTTSAPPPYPLPTDFVSIDQRLFDPELGNIVQVKRIARDLAWPDAERGEELAFELVAVEMTWTTSVFFTSQIRLQDFAVASGAAYPNRVDHRLDATLAAAGWSMLPDSLAEGQELTGWAVFKIDPRGAASMRLDYTRPAARVVNQTGLEFPKRLFSAQLVGDPAALETTSASS